MNPPHFTISCSKGRMLQSSSLSSSTYINCKHNLLQTTNLVCQQHDWHGLIVGQNNFGVDVLQPLSKKTNIFLTPAESQIYIICDMSIQSCDKISPSCQSFSDLEADCRKELDCYFSADCRYELDLFFLLTADVNWAVNLRTRRLH